MKLSSKTLVPFALVATFGLGTLAPHAQTPAQKVGFVDVAKLLAAHPNDKDIKKIQEAANKELDDLNKKVKDIDAKGASATAAERQTREQLVATIQTKAKNYQAQIDPKVQVLEKAVDTAVNSVSKANGYSIVMDRGVAARSNLVIYADETTDLTNAALKILK